MPFGQPVLDTITTQPNGNTKLSNEREKERDTERDSDTPAEIHLARRPKAGVT